MQIDLVGVPMDFGAGRRGVDMGPSAIRYAGLIPGLEGLGYAVNDWGNLDVPGFETCELCDPKLRFLDCILSVNRLIADRVAASFASGRFPLTLGGDHSMALGSISGAARQLQLGLIWIDAHGDFNTSETTPSGNIHGMPLAALAGYGDPRLVGLGFSPDSVVLPARIAVVGVRDLDAQERPLLRQAGVAVFSMEQIDRQGMFAVIQQAIEIVSANTDGIYLSLDMDALDPVYAPGVGTSVPGGLTYREAHLACEVIAGTGRLLGMDVVEVNAILDEHNKTALVAVELILSALGKKVW